MHSHTKLERSVATNDTTLTNDQRNKLDNNVPVRAPPAHNMPRRHAQFPVCLRVPTHVPRHDQRDAVHCASLWPAPPQPDPCTAGPLRPSTCAKPDLSAMQPEITRQANLCSEPC